MRFQPCSSRLLVCRRLSACLSALLLLAILPTIPAAINTPAYGQTADPFSFVKEIILKDADGVPLDPANPPPGPPAIDFGLRRLVTQVGGNIHLLDLDTLEQDAILDVGGAGGRVSAIDSTAHRIFYGFSNQINTFSLTSSFEPQNFAFPASLEGQELVGAIAYDEERKLLYAVTNVKIQPPFSPAIFSRTTMHSFDASSATLNKRWSYELEDCFQPLTGAAFQQPFLGVGSTGDFVYLACRGNIVNNVQTAMHGVVRLNLGAEAGSEAQENFTREFYPFGANLQFGVSFGDQGGDLIAIVPSAGSTNRIYVFNALQRSWTGSVPMGNTNVIGAAPDPSSGRIYMVDQGERPGGAGTSAAVVTDGRQLPVPQGQRYSLGVFVSGGGHPVFDPDTRQLFVVGPGFALEQEEGKPQEFVRSHFRVYEDRTPLPEEVVEANPDADTHPPEIPGRTPVSFSGLASAYGAREIFVGGRRGAGVDPSSGTEQNFFAWVKRAMVDTTVSRASAIRSEFQDADDDPDPPPVSSISECRDETGESKVSATAGSSVSCDLDNFITTATATASQENSPSQSAVGVSSSYSNVTVKKDPVFGMVVEAEAMARGISIGGVISIGEVRVTATAVAKGATGTAFSEFNTTIKGFISPGGACGGLGQDECDPDEVAAEINRTFEGRIQAHVPKPDQNPQIAGSDGGAQAIVIRDPYYFWSEKNANDDDQKEVPGLQLTVYNDRTEPSRQVIQFAAVLLEAHYTIGLPGEEPLPGTSALRIELTDASDPPKPLAGGAFEVYADEDGDKIVGLSDTLIDEGTCVTADDGVGDCDFAAITPGDYVIREAKAPKGYFASSDLAVELLPGFRSVATFVNPRAVGDVEVTLTDESSNKLSGGAFELYADNGNRKLDADDQKVGSCTTDGNGFCAFPDASLNSYLLHQTAAPAGYVKSDDIPFALSEPGQKAKVNVVNGTEGVPATPGTPDQPATPGSAVPESTVVIEGGSGSRQTQVAQEPIAPAEPNLLLRVVRLPAEALKLLLRNPLQALLFGVLWVLLGLPLWMARRRRLGWLVARSASV